MRGSTRKLAEAPRAPVVAAVAARRRAGADGWEFLLVRTHDGMRWTFPKGHQDSGETLARAAAREALEEAGVEGAVEHEPFARYRYVTSGGREDVVAAFRLSVEREGRPIEEHRDPTWFGREAARGRLAAGRHSGYDDEIELVLRAAVCDGDA